MFIKDTTHDERKYLFTFLTILETLLSKRTSRPSWNWIIIICTVTNSFVFVVLLANSLFLKQEIFAISGTIGDTLGPIIGIVGALLVYQAYLDQRKTNDFNASTFYTNLLMEELNRIKEEIPIIEFEGQKGRESVRYFLNKMNTQDVFFDGGPNLTNKLKRVWEIEFHEYLNNLIFLLSKIHNQYLKIDDLNLDIRLKKTLTLKIDELIYRYLGNYQEVWDEVSSDLLEAKFFERNNVYDTFKIYDINTLIKLQSKYEQYLTKFVEDGFVLHLDRYSKPSDEIFNPKIDFEKIEKLNLTKVYRLPKVNSD